MAKSLCNHCTLRGSQLQLRLIHCTNLKNDFKIKTRYRLMIWVHVYSRAEIEKDWDMCTQKEEWPSCLERDGGRLTQLSLIPSHMPSGDHQSDEKKTRLDLKKKNLNLSFLHSKSLSQCFLFISLSSKRFEQIPFLYPIIPQCVHTTNFAGSCERDYCF